MHAADHERGRRTVDNCVFCMIANHQMDSRVVYEDDDIIVIDDITPQAPVHVLIIPKTHYANMSDDVPTETIGAVFSAVPKAAALKGIDETGYRVVVNTGRDAAQSVAHLHVHVMGGAPMSHGMVHFD